MTPRRAARLALDEMFAPTIAAALRDLRHDVVAVAEQAEMRAMTDTALFSWACSQGRWLLAENVKDFRPILLGSLQAGTVVTGVLFTSNRSFPRSRKNPGPLIEALHTWLLDGAPDAPVSEDWLRPRE